MGTAISIGDVLTNFDAARRPIKSSARIAGATPYLGASGVVDYVEGHTHDGAFLCVSEDGANLLTRNLPIAWVQTGKFWANNHLHVLGGVSLPRLRFFAAALERANISSAVTGSAQPKLSQKSLSSIEIPALPVAQQEAIGQILGALDDKIVANRRLIASGDELVRTVVRSASSERRKLWESVDFTFGEAFKGSFFSEPGLGRPLIRIRDIKSQKCQVWTTESRTKERVVTQGEVLVGMDAEFNATRWAGPAGLLNQRTLLASSARLGSAIVCQVLEDPLREIERSKSGTTVIHLNKSDLQRVEVEVPQEEVVGELREKVDPVWERCTSAEIESSRLAETKVELLPLLMSGKITIKDAEMRVEGEV